MADAAIRLSRALDRVGWYEHQHDTLTLFHTEKESLPLQPSLVSKEARDIAESIQQRILSTHVGTPPPELRTRAPSVQRGPDGHICLPLPADIDSRTLEQSYTWSSSEDDAIALWTPLVPELAMSWATLPPQPPLSLGRLFREKKKGRMCYWPRELNRILPHIPITYDHVNDLVSVLTRLGFKVDLKSAFRSLIITLSHARYYGACVDGVYLQFHRAPFGSAVSPAHFVLHLRDTIVKARGSTPASDEVITAFVDDCGGGAGGPDLPTASTNLLRLADRLISALISDGWWLSVPKTFLWPARILYYTGVLADFERGSLSIEPGKAFGLRQRLSPISIPASELFASSPLRSHSGSPPVPQIRTACHAHSSTPFSIAALPIVRSEWPSDPLTCFVPSDSSPDLFPDPSIAWSVSVVAPSDLVPATLRALTAPAPHSTSRFVVVVLPSPESADTFISDFPSDLAARDRVAIVVYPRNLEPLGAPIRWFDPSLALPPRFGCRPLPDLARPPPLPAPDQSDPPPAPTIRTHGSLDMSPDEWHALQRVAGLLSWFGVVVPHISAWRPALDAAWRAGTWNRAAADAVCFLWDVAPFLPHWHRNIRSPTTRSVLYVTVDTSRGSWASVLTRPDGAPVYDAGTIPVHACAASTLAREAWGAVGAVAVAIRRGATFTTVVITTDNHGLADSAGTSHVPSHDASAPMRVLAALDWQGVAVQWQWSRRSTSLLPVADALSPAASVRVWPLLPHVASFVWDVTGGWHADGPSAADRSWSNTYFTSTLPDSIRARLFHAAAFQAAGATDGWVGDIRSWPDAAAGRTLFVHALWSELPLVADLTRRATSPLIIVAPSEAGAHWWAPALADIASRSTHIIPLPSDALQRPTPPPGQPTDHPRAPPRRVSAYLVGLRRIPTDAIDPARRPPWWRPYMLADDGDIHLHPGPFQEEDTSAFARSGRPRQRPPPPSSPPRRSAPPTPPRARHSRPVPTARQGFQEEDTAGFARATRSVPTAPTTVPAPAGPVSTRKRLRSPAPAPAPSQPASARPAHLAQALVAHQAAAPPAPPPTTVAAWLRALRVFVDGRGPGIADPEVPESMRPYVATARATCRLKAVLGSSRPDKAVRYMTQLAMSLPGTPEAPLSTAVVDALAVTYAVRRLEPDPPFGWKTCKLASTVASDLSSIAEISRKAGHGMHAQCGPTAGSYLAARGSHGKKDHSDAWPIHLAEIIRMQPSDRASPAWRTWSGIMILSAFCLRPGVIPHLPHAVFIRWAGGLILVWRWAFKATGVDVMDPELKSPVTRVSAARFPALMTMFDHACTLGPRPWSAHCSSSDMAAFIRERMPSAPASFTLRPYGVRIAADVCAVALDLPEDLTNALFWWRRIVQSFRMYYGALSIMRMYIFSEARTRLRCVHITPGRFDARLTGPMPVFTAKALLKSKAPLLPEPEPTVLEAAWAADGTTLATQRLASIARESLPSAVWTALPADAPAGDAASDSDNDMSADCDECGVHVSRHRRATLCSHEGCPLARCTRCHTYNTDWHCKGHQPPKKARRRKAPA